MADSDGSHAPRSPFRAWKAFVWSMQGLRATWLVESSFRLEVYLFVVLAPLTLWLTPVGVERAILIGSMMLVLIIEVLNSAVEAVVDRHGREHNELAGRAKDMGSAAVFLADMNVLACWGLILGPRWLAAAQGAA
jgi:diacylglycerol kinase (ATP)